MPVSDTRPGGAGGSGVVGVATTQDSNLRLTGFSIRNELLKECNTQRSIRRCLSTPLLPAPACGSPEGAPRMAALLRGTPFITVRSKTKVRRRNPDESRSHSCLSHSPSLCLPSVLTYVVETGEETAGDPGSHSRVGCIEGQGTAVGCTINTTQVRRYVYHDEKIEKDGSRTRSSGATSGSGSFSKYNPVETAPWQWRDFGFRAKENSAPAPGVATGR